MEVENAAKMQLLQALSWMMAQCPVFSATLGCPRVQSLAGFLLEDHGREDDDDGLGLLAAGWHLWQVLQEAWHWLC